MVLVTYMCGASIIPLTLRANPQATIFGVAEHGAGLIKASITSDLRWQSMTNCYIEEPNHTTREYQISLSIVDCSLAYVESDAGLAAVALLAPLEFAAPYQGVDQGVERFPLPRSVHLYSQEPTYC